MCPFFLKEGGRDRHQNRIKWKQTNYHGRMENNIEDLFLTTVLGATVSQEDFRKHCRHR